MSKKQITVYGDLKYPLIIGGVAYIQTKEGVLRTSSVQHFIQHPDGTMDIETKNSRYILCPPAKEPQATGAVS